MFLNRKQVISEAKESIKNDLWEVLNDFLDQRMKVSEEIEKETSPWLEERLSILDAKIIASQKKIQEWNMSKGRKKKKSIQWIDDRTRDEVRFSKPSKQINWEAAAEVSDTNRSIRKNNRSWLSEGTMVVHRSDTMKKEPMIVVDISDSGLVSALKEGDLVRFRSLSLRPAFED